MARGALFHLARSQTRTLTSAFPLRLDGCNPVCVGCHLSGVGDSTAARFSPCPQTFGSKIDTNPVLKFAQVYKRMSSRASTSEDTNKISIGPQNRKEEENKEMDTGVVYYGPISNTIKKVKLLSLSTCCLSVSLGPVITFMTSPDMNVILKGAVASTVIFLSASTTAALHWFVSPYIHKLRWQPGSDSFEAEMLSWLATHLPRTIKFADIQPAETKRPFVTFKANGNLYFVDVEHCHNKALLAKLTPQKQAHGLPSRTCDVCMFVEHSNDSG